MRVLAAMFVAFVATLTSTFAIAQSVDVESDIKSIDTNKMTISLADGKTYTVPEEFNFEGLEAGVKVNVFYTVIDGKRVVDDLIVVQ